GSSESQRVQETLFHEKQMIIENCLFGVDINPNSVKICRLRLWIELLKNAYYKSEGELETLPNIDINIKCGNSLISRYDLDVDIADLLKNSKFDINTYKDAHHLYQHAPDKAYKHKMEELIENIKGEFKKYISKLDPVYVNLRKVEHKFRNFNIETGDLFGVEKTAKQKTKDKAKLAKLSDAFDKAQAAVKDAENNVIYSNAFEWRFEFPEVLDNKGDFIGFDVVIGNPPYVGIEDIAWDYRRFYERAFNSAKGRFDLYSLFVEQSKTISKNYCVTSLIVPSKFLNNKQFKTPREIFSNNKCISIVYSNDKIFPDAEVNSSIITNYIQDDYIYKTFVLEGMSMKIETEVDIKYVRNDSNYTFRVLIDEFTENLISKIDSISVPLKDIAEVKDGIVAGCIKDVLYLNQKSNEYCEKLYFGKHLQKYHILDTNTWVNYQPETMMELEVERKNGKRPGLWLRDKRIFEREKILSRFVAKEIIATYDDKNRYYEHTLHSTFVFDKKFNTKYILGLFNSKLWKYYYKARNSEAGSIFPQVRISSLESMPVVYANINMQNKIIDLVDKILNEKELQRTKKSEKEIDQLVYKLYDLTKEEIKIVEGELA
ncbi:MAG: Eco57I restriction-modification methylase domain-containing protein, partial [Clostridiales bacterium]|nr:Eco57I restriction-modification methylase domain-containing protein [Clostridiales bacterium]